MRWASGVRTSLAMAIDDLEGIIFTPSGTAPRAGSMTTGPPRAEPTQVWRTTRNDRPESQLIPIAMREIPRYNHEKQCGLSELCR